MGEGLLAKNVTIAGLRTSLRLEPEIWAALDEVCRREGLTVHTLCTLIDRHRGVSSRTSAVRAFMVSYYRDAATNAGHRRAGHGSLPAAAMAAARRRRAASPLERALKALATGKSRRRRRRQPPAK